MTNHPNRSKRTPKTRTEQLAEALLAIARVDHYTVGIVEPITNDELDGAEQLIISGQNALPMQSGTLYDICNLALDIIEHMRRRRS